MKIKTTLTLSLLTTLLLLPALALAAGNIDVKIKAEKLAVVIKDGKKITRFVPTTKLQPGDTIQYSITYSNNGTEPVVEAIINDPIPAGTVYITDSAKGEGTEITFSIDNGKTFKKPTLLFYETTSGTGVKEQRTASPDQYTNIRWTVSKPIPPKGKGKVFFQVKVK